ncbi:MAG TPA: hypothetical protein DC017_14785 [Candidatus Wallbacteria bacterium]|nr:hypothetical protein [Candidatus Wallbacteria bacterium]
MSPAIFQSGMGAVPPSAGFVPKKWSLVPSSRQPLIIKINGINAAANINKIECALGVRPEIFWPVILFYNSL